MNKNDDSRLDKTCYEWIHSLSAKSIAGKFGHLTLCDYIQDQDYSWCEARGACTDCVEQWLTERKLKDFL